MNVEQLIDSSVSQFIGFIGDQPFSVCNIVVKNLEAERGKVLLMRDDLIKSIASLLSSPVGLLFSKDTINNAITCLATNYVVEQKIVDRIEIGNTFLLTKRVDPSIFTKPS